MSSYKRIILPLLLAAGLIALPAGGARAQNYDTFEDNAKRRVEQFIGRAERLEDEQAWSNYVELGVATERIAWENEAYELLQRKIEDIEETQTDEDTRDAEIAQAEADYENARQDWEAGAEDYINEGRGKFLAREEALDVARGAAARFETLIAAAEAQAAQQAVFEGRQAESAFGLTTPADLLGDFDQQLNAEISRARATAAGLTGVERENFEEELQDIETDIRREFDIRKNYFLAGEDDRLVALPRNDELDAKIAPAGESATAAREELVEQAREALADDTAEKLAKARAKFEARLDDHGAQIEPDQLAADWEKETAAILAEAGKEWTAAGETYATRRTAWLRERGTPSGQERQAWTDNQHAFEEARAEWQQELQQQFDQARTEQQKRLEQMRRDKERAEL